MDRSGKNAYGNVITERFLHTDRVKTFNRAVLLSNTVEARDQQVEQNRRAEQRKRENERKCVLQRHQQEKEAMEQDLQEARQRQMKKKAYGEALRRQMKEKELLKERKKLEKQYETEDSHQIQLQYEREQRFLTGQRQVQKTDVSRAYAEQIMQKDSVKEIETRNKEAEEECQKCYVTEKDQWTQMHKEKLADRLARQQNLSEMLAQKLVAQQRERDREEEEMLARSVANLVAQEDAIRRQQAAERMVRKVDLLTSIACHMEYKQRKRELKEMEEKQREEAMLTANKEADRAHWQAQSLMAQRKREGRLEMDSILRKQMEEKCLAERIRRQEQLEFDHRNSELLSQEDRQFGSYVTGVISAAESAKRNITSLCRAAEQVIGCGSNPAIGRRKSNYFVPGANYAAPQSCMSSAILRSTQPYGPLDLQTTKTRLGFI